MKGLTQALCELAEIFDSLSVDYAVMGGFAVRIDGIPRPTHDVDFTVAMGRDRLPAFFDLAEQIGFTVPESYRQGWVDTISAMPLVKLRMNMEGHGVDADLFLAETAFQSSLLARRRREAIDGFSIWFVSPEDLVLLKLVANRPRDLLDVHDVLFTQGQLDREYLGRWAQTLGILDQLKGCLQDFDRPTGLGL
jgi:hypothetical protein